MSKTFAVVLGAAVWSDGQASPTLARRVNHAARLWHNGTVSAIICCGGIGRHPPSEATVMARLLETQAVPPEAIWCEDRSTDTISNIEMAITLCPQLKHHHVLIVTDRYHAFRSVMIARHLGLSAKANCPDPRGQHRARLARAYLRDKLALLKTAHWMVRRRLP